MIGVLGLALVVFGLIMLTGDENAPSRIPGGTDTKAASPTPPRPVDTSEPTGFPGNEASVQLYAWSRAQSRWTADEISEPAGSLREGESVPFLLRLEDAVIGRVYAINIRYECATDAGAALDFLLAPDDSDASALLTAPGPRRARPDSGIAVSDDQTIAFDDGAERTFQLWGGTFQLSPQGPLPAAPCEDVKEFVLAVVAQQPTVFLVWAAHLASQQNWGEGRAAAAQDAAVFVEASVTGTAASQVQLGPGLVKP